MEKFLEKIIRMIDKGENILNLAELFGGIDELLSITKKYPYLNGIIQTKLGGTIFCSAENENGDMVPFEFPFILSNVYNEDEHFYADVNLIIPEIKNSPKLMRMMYCWMEDYLMDLGIEVGHFNDKMLNNTMTWINVDKINGYSFYNTEEVSDEEVLKIIPDEYKEH